MVSHARSTARPGRSLHHGKPVVVAGVVALIALAGCTGTSPGKRPPAAEPMSASKAITLAASAAQHVTSLTAAIGVTLASKSEHFAAVMRLRYKPTTLIDMTMTVTAPSIPTTHIDEILTSKALFLKDPSLSQSTGKQWVEVSLAQLSSKSGINFATLLQNVENSNPENQVRFFAASKDIHVVRSQTLNGVPTTEYAGTYTPAAALAELPAGLRKLLGPTLHLMGTSPVPFRVWIDKNHLTRMAIVSESIAGQSAVTTFSVTSVNQPLQIALPPPGEVAQLPHP